MLGFWWSSFCLLLLKTEQKRMRHTISCSGYLNIMPGYWEYAICFQRVWEITSIRKNQTALSIWHSNQVATFHSSWSRQLWREPNWNLGECTFKLHYISNDTRQNFVNLSQFQNFKQALECWTLWDKEKWVIIFYKVL